MQGVCPEWKAMSRTVQWRKQYRDLHLPLPLPGICPVTQAALLKPPFTPSRQHPASKALSPDSRRGCTKAKRTWVRALEPNSPGWSPSSGPYSVPYKLWHIFVSVHCPLRRMPRTSPLHDTLSDVRGFSFPSLRKLLWSQTARVQILVPLNKFNFFGPQFPSLKMESAKYRCFSHWVVLISELTHTNHLYLVLNSTDHLGFCFCVIRTRFFLVSFPELKQLLQAL